MPEPVVDEASTTTPGRLRERFIDTFRWMVLARAFEDKVASQYRAGKIIGGVYLGKGQEAFSAALGGQLQRGKDVFGPLIRDQAGRFAFGESLIDAARTYCGSSLGPMRGRDGNIHRGRPADGMPAMISHLGAMVPVVNGMLFARRHKGETGIVGATSLGDGATSTGAFHEGLNQAAVERLPLVIAVANNQFAYSTPNRDQFACADLAERAKGYGIEAQSVDGTDLEACLVAFERAIAKTRDGGGPQMVVGKLLRLTGHGEHDDASYVTDEMRTSHHGRDCILLARQRLIVENWAQEDAIEAWEQDAADQVQEAIATAQQEPTPDPFNEGWRCIATKALIEGGGQGQP